MRVHGGALARACNRSDPRYLADQRQLSFHSFFFVLSGFIIFENYYDRIRNGFGLMRFMFLRFGRLYPLHAAVLAMFLIEETARVFKNVPGGRAAFSDPNSMEGLLLHLSLLNAHGLYPVPT